jgi:hypothetical protein
MQRTVHTLAEIDPLLGRVRAAAKRTTRAIGELRTSHPTMPNLMLSGTERSDLIAYILSLR